MDAFSLADRTTGDSKRLSGSVLMQASQDLPEERRKGLSIVDSARRDLEATLQLLADRAQYITGASGAAIALRDGDRVLCRASSGSAAPELGVRLDLSSGLSGECVRTRSAMSCDDTANDPRVNRESCRRLGIASLSVMPILRDDEVIGIFEIFSNKTRAFQERDLLALERLREMVNVALDHATPERPKTAAFAIHGVKVKVIGSPANDGVASVSRPRGALSVGENTAAFDSENMQMDRAEKTILDHISACHSCGFPVSEGRELCLDCEAKGIKGSDFGISAVAGHAERKGVKRWLITNRYVIGMVLISAATIAFALLR